MEAHPAYGVIRQVNDVAAVLLENNPGPYTLDGTNTWLLRVPGSADVVVVDPGEDDAEHLDRVVDHAPVALILLSHRHHDHAGGASRLAERTGAPVLAADPALTAVAPLVGGEVLTAAGLTIRVLATPGHTTDSVCFTVDGALLSGDTVLGRGTTLLDHPDGRLADYLDSLRMLADLPPGTALLPGHGPDLADAAEVAREYLAHRERRLDQVRAALAELGRDATARQVVELVYADVDPSVWTAAEWNVQAQLAYLDEPG